MVSRFVSLLAGLAALGPAGAASAADLLPPPPVLDEAPAVQAPLGSGWYLRGDVSYVDYGKPKDEPYGAPGIPPLDRERIEETWAVGAGVGYRINNWLRVDATVDHRFKSDFSALSSGTGYTRGYSIDQAQFESTAVLANAYVDLGTWSGITPYVGAGVGFARNTLNQYSGQVYLFPGPTASGPPSPLPSDTEYAFAYAAMAGVGVELSHGLTLDVGYRYMNLGKAKTGLDVFKVGTKLKEIDAHEVRFGVRWLFADLAGRKPPLAYHAPAPRL